MSKFKILAAAFAVYATLCSAAFAESRPAPVPESMPAVTAPAVTLEGTADPDPGYTTALLEDMKKELNLTDAQIERVRPLIIAHEIDEKNYFVRLERKLESVLTPAQLQRLEGVKAQAASSPDALKNVSISAALQLTPAQMSEMQAFVTQSHSEMQARNDRFFADLRNVLGVEQQARLDQLLAAPPDDVAPASH